MLGPREVVPYLQARGYLTTSGAALDGITIEDASRRNTNLKVLRPRGMSYFLKQARDADGAAHLAHEASIYQTFEPMFAEIRLVAVFRSSLDMTRTSTSLSWSSFGNRTTFVTTTPLNDDFLQP